MTRSISFIHLSDIHFTKYSGDNLDLDKDLRNEILRDIRDNAKNIIGKADGVLVCGDIAFSGKQEEYERATEFLKELCHILKINETSIFCVPGNHDVNQLITKGSPGFQDIQKAIEKDDNIDLKLADYFRDTTFSSMLFHHIQEYNNKFAAKFRCNINVNTPYWNKYFQLTDDGLSLCLVGLNSITISSHLDNDKRLMVLGQYQIPQRKDGVVYVSLCHHPPECWVDPNNIIKNKINERVHVQLYGHKHIQKVSKINNSLVIGSGATHPSRSEKNWIPRYNWLTMHVEGSKDAGLLNVVVYPRILNETSDCFVADNINCNGSNFTVYSLNLNNWGGSNMTSLEDVNVEEINSDSEKVIVRGSYNPIRTLVYRFLELSYISRFSILSKLSLIEEEDDGVSHIDLIDKVLKKAQMSRILHLFWKEVNVVYYDGRYVDTENPFKFIPR